MPLPELMRRMKEHMQEIKLVYDQDINKQHIKAPSLLDNRAFAKIKHLLT